MNTENIGRVLISVLSVVAFVAFVGLITFLPIPTDMKDVVNTAGGILGSSFVAVVNYWLGSSAGSSAKDKTITSLTQKP